MDEEIENIQQVVADYFSISITDMKSVSRKEDYAFPRQIAMALIYYAMNGFTLDDLFDLDRKVTGKRCPLKRVGLSFSKRHYSTVIHAIQSIQHWVDEERRRLPDAKKPHIESIIRHLWDAIGAVPLIRGMSVWELELSHDFVVKTSKESQKGFVLKAPLYHGLEHLPI